MSFYRDNLFALSSFRHLSVTSRVRRFTKVFVPSLFHTEDQVTFARFPFFGKSGNFVSIYCIEAINELNKGA